MRIVLIDDEPFMLGLLEQQLIGLGFADVASFTQAGDALEALRNHPSPELIVCDLQMPQMDGIEFIRNLVRLEYAGALILVSGEDERLLQAAQRLARAHGLRIAGALSKPVPTEALRKMLARLVGAEQPRIDSAIASSYAPARVGEALANGELFNLYQPKVSLATGRVTGVEALVRWLHPQDGVVSPDLFVAVAEEHGHIDALTRSVVESAVRDARTWRDRGMSLQLAVNVSMENLMSLAFPDDIARIVEDAGLEPADLILELTESRLMRSPVGGMDTLTRLKLKRFTLSIDDFGTGHASLEQLLNIPFDELKVDRRFVHGAHSDPSCRAILEASLSMARQLGLRSVAEGVEDREDWDYLRAHECDLAQGYFIARPMPSDALPEWMAEWDMRCPLLLAPAIT